MGMNGLHLWIYTNFHVYFNFFVINVGFKNDILVISLLMQQV